MINLTIEQQKKINGGDQTLYIVKAYKNGRIVDQQEVWTQNDVDMARTSYLWQGYWPVKVTKVRV